MKFEQWNGFYGTEWQQEINVRQFIADNYTPYLGDSSFLEGPTERTKKLMGKFEGLLKEERDAAARQTRQLQQELVIVYTCFPHNSFIIIAV